jgi:hypothetical protein
VIAFPVQLASYAVIVWLAIATDLLTTQAIWRSVVAAIWRARHAVFCRRRGALIWQFHQAGVRLRCARCGWRSPGWQK